jgi:hypothetical protein
MPHARSLETDDTKKTVLTFGLISGAVSSVMMLATVPFADAIGFDEGAIIGYTTIVLSSLVVFFGVRSYRDNIAAGPSPSAPPSPSAC